MRRFTAFFLGTLLAAPLSAADPNCSLPNYPYSVPPTCEAPPSYPGTNGPGQICGCNHPQCPTCCQQKPPCNPPSQPRGGPPAQPRGGPEVQTRETGFFQAPPRSGATQGPARSLGMSLGTITIPEVRLRMPSIELPSFFRSRQSARMSLDSTTAPWVSTGFESVNTGGMASVNRARGAEEDTNASRGAEPRAAQKSDCEDVKREYEEKLKALNQKLDECEKLKRCIQECLNDHAAAATSARRPIHHPGFDQMEPVSTRGGEPGQPIGPPNPPPDDARLPPPHELQPATYWAPTTSAGQASSLRRVSPTSPRLVRLPTPAQ